MHPRRLIAFALIAAGALLSPIAPAHADILDPYYEAQDQLIETARPGYEVIDEDVDELTGGETCIGTWEDCPESTGDAFLCSASPQEGPLLIVDVNGTCDVEDDPLVCVFYPWEGQPADITFNEPCRRDGTLGSGTLLCSRAPDRGPWIIVEVNGTCDVEDDPLVCAFYPEDGEPGAVTFSESCERDGATITL